ncbi:isoprenylcysteine carboxyl methyltransferase [Pseudomonas alcaligenes]|uniref:Isoprenylcysteine carboxyl methyltransferase n=1 Tax=Aquipseudomonas alcaligenes TaxID=43263 RepID=A0ABR7RV01_AQUAC|nr:methyltransferase [Pseudomonas alcaligenes]MBC9249036.1 isoprenylcysteine carboxyl methyltransferase [Pseudomonas alcaligenes]
MLKLQAVAFVLGSLALLGVSWRALRNPQAHGFYRFFAWEAMLALLVLNAPVWFVDRYALHQRVSWLLLFTSLLALFLGLYQLRRFGRATAQRQDTELYAFERTSQLVTSGIYRYIRHPLYCSLLLLAWGIACKQLNGLTLALGLLSSLLLFAAARRDEAECLAYFGEAYRDYMARSKRFIPFLF